MIIEEACFNLQSCLGACWEYERINPGFQCCLSAGKYRCGRVMAATSTGPERKMWLSCSVFTCKSRHRRAITTLLRNPASQLNVLMVARTPLKTYHTHTRTQGRGHTLNGARMSTLAEEASARQNEPCGQNATRLPLAQDSHASCRSIAPSWCLLLHESRTVHKTVIMAETFFNFQWFILGRSMQTSIHKAIQDHRRWDVLPISMVILDQSMQKTWIQPSRTI